MPKRATTPYVIYVAKNINKVRAELGENSKHADAMKKCGEIWKKMTEKQKKPWNAEAEKDKLR